MNGNWVFPESNTMHRTGLGEAGIETFNGDPVSSLVRETCQNSLDAVKNETSPVTVEFKNFEIPTDNFPDGKTLLKIFKLCRNFSNINMENKRTYNFFNNAAELFDKNKIKMLRISDYNTKGLLGSDNINGINQWTSLIYSDGVSDKSKDSAGSFGIGKNAPFACSEFRTVFYSTLDYTGRSAYQGVSKLISFQNENGKFAESIGYFGDNQHPVYELLNLDREFNRSESGTDIFISAFKSDSDFEMQIICSVLENFILSIFNEKLNVIVNDKKINKDSLPDLMQKYSADLKYANDYYKVLISDKSVSAEIPVGNIGNINFKVLFDKNFKRRILMSRNNGMKIYDQGQMPSSIYFAGVVTTKDENVNQFFRSMENPQHNTWEPNRFDKDSPKYKKILKQMKQDIKKFIIAKGQGDIADQVDAEGVGEFLPDLSKELVKSEDKINDEGLSYHTGDVSMERLQIKNDSNDEVQNNSFDDGIDHMSDMYGDYDENGTMKGYLNGNGHRKGKRPPAESYTQNSEGAAALFERKAFLPLSIRMMVINSVLNIYKLIFSLKNGFNKGYIEIDLSGEQGNDKAKIDRAFILNKLSAEKLKCSENRIYLKNIYADQKVSIEFKLDFPINCSLEAKIYGY